MFRDEFATNDLIGRRKRPGLGKYDEVGDGVYVVPPVAKLPFHAGLGVREVQGGRPRHPSPRRPTDSPAGGSFSSI